MSSRGGAGVHTVDECSFGGVGGVIAATKGSILTTTDALLTSIAVDVINSETVLVAGTADGRLKKVR